MRRVIVLAIRSSTILLILIGCVTNILNISNRELVKNFDVEAGDFTYLSVPFHYQSNKYYCGSAALEMVFDYYGEDISQTEIADVARTHPHVTYTDELRRAAHFSNLSTSLGTEMLGNITGYTTRKVGYAAFEKWELTVEELKFLINKGEPMIVLMWWTPAKVYGHYRVVIGYNETHMIMHDPWNKDAWGGTYGGANTSMTYSTFLDLWEYIGYWGLWVHPWTVTLQAPSDVNKGDNFEVKANITYPCPASFDTEEYPASFCSANIELHEGLELALEETTEHSLGNITAGNFVQTSWSIHATETGSRNVSVTVIGTVEGNVGTHETYPFYSYMDEIGGLGFDSLLVFYETYGVHNLDTGLKYTSIQDAVDAPETLDGHRIFVEKGTYYEHIVANKAVRLFGENRTTIIHGYGVGLGIQVIVNNVSVSGFTIKRYEYGIYLEKASNCIIEENLVTECESGILLFNSGGNTLRSNNMTSNVYNFGVGGRPPVTMSEMINEVDTSNIVDSKAIYYLINQHDITIDASANPAAGYVTVINSTNIVVKDLNLTHNRHSVLFFNVWNSTIRNIRAYDNNRGITVSNCSNCTISENTVTATPSAYTSGLEIFYSENIAAFENTIVNSTEGFMLYSSQNIALNKNTVNFTTYGTYLLYSNSSVIRKNTVSENFYGISLGYSINNTLIENNIIQNNHGIAFLYPSNDNIIYHNNFLENKKQVYSENSINVWDNEFEGNFWSDYSGTDYNHDGIGNMSYVINADNIDNYPLMGMFHSFNSGYSINVISNSTIEDFEYFTNQTIKMHIFNITSNQRWSFCRLCIPHALMDVNNLLPIIDNGLGEWTLFNDNIHDNGTHRWVYFAFAYPAHEIAVLLEFPSFLILPIFMMITLLTVMVYRRKTH